MKFKFVFIIIIAISGLSACGEDNTEILKKASKKICSCLEETVQLNEKLIKVSKADTTNTRVIEIMREISKSADSGFSCVDRSLKRYQIKEKQLQDELTHLLQKECPDVAEMIARE